MGCRGTECTVDELDERIRSKAKRAIGTEEVLMCYEFAEEPSSWQRLMGHDPRSVEAYIITPSHYFCVRSNRAGSDLPIDIGDVGSVSHRKLAGGIFTVEFSAHPMSQTLYFTSEEARERFSEVLVSCAEQARRLKAVGLPQSSATVEQRLQALESLYRRKIISEAEYTQKRNQVLADL